MLVVFWADVLCERGESQIVSLAGLEFWGGLSYRALAYFSAMCFDFHEFFLNRLLSLDSRSRLCSPSAKFHTHI